MSGRTAAPTGGLRLAVEASVLANPPHSGIARSVLALCEALARRPELAELTLYVQATRRNRRHAHLLPQGPRVRRRWWGGLLPRARPTHDAVLASFLHRPPGIDGPLLLWVYDLYAHFGMSYLDPAWRRATLARLDPLLGTADALACISEATRRDAVALFGADPARCHVVPLAVSERFAPAPDLAVTEARRRHGLGAKPYLLFAGLCNENKNLPRLLAAYAGWAERERFHLALATPTQPGHPLHEQLLRVLDLHGVRRQVRLIGHVTDDDLVALYTGCAAFVFPSLYEGFGLPILEAMRCGAPVLTSTHSACVDTAGGHAELADPWKLASLREGLSRAVRRTPEQRAAAMAYAQSLSWDAVAEQLLAVVAAMRAAASAPTPTSVAAS